MEKITACLICGKPLVYTKQSQQMECIICHKEYTSNACCQNGHFVCDSCHSKEAIEMIVTHCQNSSSKNPTEIMTALMNSPAVHMHGPEHHILVGSALLTAYYNAGGKLELTAALQEMQKRGQQVPGGICGLWGSCGAAISTGIFISLITGATPLTKESWGLANLMTSAALKEIGNTGGPRCCKRNAYLAITTACRFVKDHLKIEMELPQTVVCHYFQHNAQCIKERCPYYSA